MLVNSKETHTDKRSIITEHESTKSEGLRLKVKSLKESKKLSPVLY